MWLGLICNKKQVLILGMSKMYIKEGLHMGQAAY